MAKPCSCSGMKAPPPSKDCSRTLIKRSVESIRWNPLTKEAWDMEGNRIGTAELVGGILVVTPNRTQGKWYPLEGEKIE